MKTSAVYPIVFLFFTIASLQAKTPLTGQISRFQSNLLREEKSFKVTGAALRPGRAKMGLDLLWEGVGSYQVSLTNVPKSFFQDDTNGSRWTLFRRGKSCVLKTDQMTVNCPPPEFWATLEFSGRGDLATRQLVERGFYSEADAPYIETDSRTYKAPEKGEQRVAPAVGNNGAKPIAVLEIIGPKPDTEITGEVFPLLQFDPTFLSPLLARFKSEDDVYTIRATSDLEVRRHRSRNTYILSERVDISAGKNNIASFIRSEPKPTGKIAPFTLPRAITDLSSLKDSLSDEGQQFLKAFFLIY